MVKMLIHPEDLAFQMLMHRITTSKCMMQKLIVLKGEIEKSTNTIKYLCIPSSILGEQLGQKSARIKEI